MGNNCFLSIHNLLIIREKGKIKLFLNAYGIKSIIMDVNGRILTLRNDIRIIFTTFVFG